MKRKDSALTGYEFVVKSLIDMAPTDAMKELLNIAGIDINSTPKLKAPEPKPEPAPEPKPETEPKPVPKRR